MRDRRPDRVLREEGRRAVKPFQVACAGTPLAPLDGSSHRHFKPVQNVAWQGRPIIDA
ncbi:hypothetical protein PCAR4_1370008 [Paraburkholderia caribensis]|nr:hypothetical protein PCAR4_1370008 [Paraburkholderia caribensis]